MKTCIKCGGKDISVLWIKEDTTKLPNQMLVNQDKFIKSQEGSFGIIILNEHLEYYCKSCLYAEAGNTFENKKIKEWEDLI